MKHNRQSSTNADPKALVGVAGHVKKQFVEQNSFLANYEASPEEADKPVYRREMFDGRPHTVFPAVLAVEGVMNDALVTADELARSAPAWNGRAIPLLHPESMGLPISVAESPDVLERRVGTVFGATFDGKRLKAELWIDDQKMDHLGATDVVSAMLQGEIVEVSTGYFSDDVLEQGEFNGVAYSVRHTNLRPDHLALLPGQIGACSIADGCGVPRVNSCKRLEGLRVKVHEALQVIAKAVGVHSNTCDCEACSMKATKAQITKAFEELKLHDNEDFLKALDSALGKKADAGFHANAGLGAKHLKMLEELDEKGLGLMSAMIEAYRASGASANEDPPDPDEDPDAMQQQQQQQTTQQNRNRGGDDKPVTLKQLNTVVANAVSEAVTKAMSEQLPAQARRSEVVAKLKANERNPFSEQELETLPVESLEKVEQSLRVNDYSGQAGFGGYYADDDDDALPPHVIVNETLAERAKSRSN